MDIEKAKKVVQEISEVCKKHGVYIVGTCWSEGMYSDIEIFEIGTEPPEWINPQKQATNEVYPSIDSEGTYHVTGIS